MKKKAAFRRRNYFIKKGLQSRFIFGFSLSVVAGFLINWFLVYYLVDKGLAEALYRSHIKIGATGEVIGDILLKVNIIAVPLLIISVIIVGLFIVNKVTIPLTGFKEALEDFERGDMTLKTLKDIPAELSASYNTMVNRLGKVFISFKMQADELGKMVTEIKHLTHERALSSQEVKDIYLSLSKWRKAMEQQCSIFKV
ncbi:MAG: methyl-accepting chemotaxis protein [Deltaproteobacteria bacterium]|nr:methyl-accepting chemotaxis protein [Deltaproteobacteria bacterium]